MADRVLGAADAILDKFGSRVVDLARINLGAYYTAKNSKGKSYRKRIDASGRLRKSLRYDLKTRGEDGRFISGRIEFSMLEYGKWVDSGRRKGKGIPLDPLIKWIKKKPLRIRDLETGSFVRATDSKIKSLAFLISRNAKKHGIKPTNFISEPIEDEYPKFAKQLVDALGDDYMNGIAMNIGNDSNKGK